MAKRNLILPITPVSLVKRGRNNSRSVSRGRSSGRTASSASVVRALRNISNMSTSRSRSQGRTRSPPNRNPQRTNQNFQFNPSFSYTTTQTQEKNKKNRKMYGAAFSKSAGYFNEKLSLSTIADRCATLGCVRKLETGNLLQDARKVTLLAHSTMPAYSVASCVFAAMFKTLFRKASIFVKNWDVPILELPCVKTFDMIVEYRIQDGYPLTTHTFIITPVVTTLQVLVDDWFVWYYGLLPTTSAANLTPKQFFKLSLYEKDYSPSVLTGIPVAQLDLTTAYVEIHSSSHLKIQNRTVTSASNDNADDVDNVPIYGKSFDYKSNSTIFRDYPMNTTVAPATLSTHASWGILSSNLASDVGTDLYEEVPLASQFVGCKRVQKAHLDPGEIKTSAMKDYLKIGFSKFFQLITQNYITGTDRNYKQTWIGKTRLFAFEKMIDAVLATEENQFRIAFEHSIMIGAIFHFKNDSQTAPQVRTLVGSIP